ncbi:flagellin [Alicyclobacillaceae bacterium I2511]|nr:flagellin [Alicyclobacillaceae bacterium I2511]
MSISFNVNNNASASNILSNLNYVQNQLNQSYQQLSSGNRVNSAADDPAGYAISQQMQSQINGLNQATQNAQTGISLTQTASGAMNQVESILQTMNTLAVEAGNGTQNSNDLSNLNQEFSALSNQIDMIGQNTQYNNMYLLTGSSSSSTFAGSGSVVAFMLQVGAQNGQTLTVSIMGISSTALGINGASISSQAAATAAIASIQAAITSLSSWQAQIGSSQDQLNYTVSNLQNAAENLQNAQATITNTNMAQEYTLFSQQQVLNQVGVAMLSQAQQQPTAVLKLLQ